MLRTRVLTAGLSAIAGAVLLTTAAPANAQGSAPSAPASGCTLTQGWYANHPTQWPWADGPSSQFANSGQTYLQVLQMSSKGGVYYQLAQQFIAAQMNQAFGSMPDAVRMAMWQAGDFFWSGATPTTPLTKAQETQLKALIPILTAYNEGKAPGGPGHCTSIPIPTWPGEGGGTGS